MEPLPRIIAVISAYNEEDIIGAAIEHLASQGVGVYLLDDGCTDATVQVARDFLGRGVVGIEELVSPDPPGTERRFHLSAILERKERLAAALDADWFINHDADEFRESPWPHLTLAGAIHLVDRLGWNAIDFDVLNFFPEGDYRAGANPTDSFRRCAPAPACDRVQVRCWKKQEQRVDLSSNAGHDVQFPGRRVFPIRFPLRHYPVRSEEQGRRKVFRERKSRFDAGERARGWHVQYDGLAEGGPLTASWGAAVEYDREAVDVNLQLENRLVEQLRSDHARTTGERDRLRGEVARVSEVLRTSEEQARTAEASVRRLDATVERVMAETADLSRRLDEVFASKSWRVTAPLRALWRLVGG
ncbi:MAG: glycosyltransferase, partial [Acidobacteria bacterium]